MEFLKFVWPNTLKLGNYGLAKILLTMVRKNLVQENEGHCLRGSKLLKSVRTPQFFFQNIEA